MKITKQFVEKLEIPQFTQRLYYDDHLKGFGVRVTCSGCKSFVVEKLINRRVRRITIGRYPEVTAEQSRRVAHKLLGCIAQGIDPRIERKEKHVKSITLKQTFQNYLLVRCELKPLTILDYNRLMNQVFKDWQNKPLLEITKDMVAKRHREHGERSKARANSAMRLLRALFNFAAGEYEDEQGKSLISENPVKRLSHTRAWYRIDRKQTVIRPHELPAWFNAVMSVHDERKTGKSSMIRDYLLLLLFTGLRREEASQLTCAYSGRNEHRLRFVSEQ